MEIITAISVLTAKHETSHAEKLEAVRRLGTLANLPQNQEAIAAAGGIPLLVALVADTREEMMSEAAYVLAWLAAKCENRQAIIEAGGIAPLVLLLECGNDDAKKEAANALANLAASPKNSGAIAAAGAIPALVTVAATGSPEAQEEATLALTYLGRDSFCMAIAAAAVGRLPSPSSASTAPSRRSLSVKVRAEIEALESSKEDHKAKAAEQLGTWATVSDENRAAISREGGVEALVRSLVNGGDQAKWHAARALRNLANNPEAKEAILKADGITTLTLVAKLGKGKVKEAADDALKLFSQQDQPGPVGADAKWDPIPAAEPAPDLPNSMSGVSAADAKSEPEPAPELPNSVSGVSAADAKSELTATAEPAPELPNSKSGVSAADAKSEPTPAAEPAPELPDSKSGVSAADANTAGGGRDNIPTGKGTRVAMFSARFDKGPMEEKFRKVFQILLDCDYDVLMVDANAGQSFADLTTEYLWRLKEEQGTLLAVCTKHYGEMTESAYSSHKELKFALDYQRFVKVLPLKVEKTYPPEPPGGPEHEYDKKRLARAYIASVFTPGVVYLDCQDKSDEQIAVEIAQYLQRHRLGTDPN